jgi:hypothetical protein
MEKESAQSDYYRESYDRNTEGVYTTKTEHTTTTQMHKTDCTIYTKYTKQNLTKPFGPRQRRQNLIDVVFNQINTIKCINREETLDRLSQGPTEFCQEQNAQNTKLGVLVGDFHTGILTNSLYA